MKVVIGVVCCLLCLCLAGASGRAPETEKFGALAHLPQGGRLSTANVDLYIKDYTTDEEAKALAGVLLEGGPDALHKALEKADSKGNITFTGRVSFYDLKLIRSHQTPEGRRIIAVGDRPIRFLEAYAGTRSTDYEFGILQMDLKRDKKGKEKGQGVLIYAAKVKVLEGNKIEIENFGINPVSLLGVRKL